MIFTLINKEINKQILVFCCRLEKAQTAQRMVADDKEDLERQLQDIGQAKVDQSCAANDDF